MKLKEFPGSLVRSLSLLVIPVSRLLRLPDQTAENCIVSFTSIPSRLGILHLTVRSLLVQSVAPERVVLWLHKSLAGSIPRSLQLLVGPRFEIRYSEQTCAHRKLVESLRAYPQKIVVTCDDDIMYQPDWLEVLLLAHKKHPNDIVAHECRCISYLSSGEVAPYSEWGGESAGVSRPGTLAIGYGGTLYPVGSLYGDVCDSTLYDVLAPRADDLWFKAMSVLQGTKTRRVEAPVKKPVPIAFSQGVSLKKFNVRQDGNVTQWRQLDAHFGLFAKLSAAKQE